MSWQKCANAEPYSLGIPAALKCALLGLHVWLCLSILMLAMPSEVVVLLWYWVLRSWQRVRSSARLADSLVLSMDARNRFYVDDVCRSDVFGRPLAGECAKPGSVHKRAVFGVTRNRLFVSGSGTPRGGQTREDHYTCCRSVKMPGCIYIDLRDDYGKRLEILVFYRYHQREFYQRLLRYLAMK